MVKFSLYYLCLGVVFISTLLKFEVKCGDIENASFYMIKPSELETPIKTPEPVQKNLISRDMRVFSGIDMESLTWARGQEVKIRFQTAQRFLEGALVGESLKMAIYLFSVKREPEISEFPIHKYEGVITEQSIAPGSAYEVTFEPPKWLPDGEYLLSFGFEDHVDFAVQISANLNGDAREEESRHGDPSVQTLISTLENFKRLPESDQRTWKYEFTKRLGSFDTSLHDVCYLCSVNEQANEICTNHIQEKWELGPRVAHEVRYRKIEKPSRPTSVREICRYARLDYEIQQLYFKYASLYHLGTASRWVSSDKPYHRDMTILWFSPFINLEYRVKFISAVNMETVIESVKSMYKLQNDEIPYTDYWRYTIEDIEGWVSKVRRLTATEEFERKLIDRTKIIVKDGLLTLTTPFKRWGQQRAFTILIPVLKEEEGRVKEQFSKGFEFLEKILKF